ncbi:unnamed protein product [Withania somnifera]
MEEPVLHLIMEKGPLSGQNLEYKPGSKIRIGRVVRGNTISIKDGGISSKHLCIQFEFGFWVINDLGSSNGTFLNKIPIDPVRPTKLTDGDVIKIGEETSIKVKIEEMEVDTRRNTRRKGLGVIDENRELGFGNVGVGLKRTTRSSKRVKNELVESFTVIEVDKEREGNSRRTRGSRKVDSVKNGVDNVKEGENVDVVDGERQTKQCWGRTRGSKKAESVKSVVDSVNEAENVDVFDGEVESKRCSGRKSGSKKVESVKDGDNVVEESESLDVVEVERQRKPSPRRTRGSRKVESVNDGNDGGKETERLVVVDADRERKLSPRRTTGCKRPQNVKWTDGVEEAKNSVAIDVDKEKKVCSRRSRGSRKEDHVENLHENAGECMELKQLRKGKGKGKGSTARMVRSEEDEVIKKLERDQKDCEEAVENANEGVERNMPQVVGVELRREGCEGSVSHAGVKMSEDVQMEEEVDLEKMTLGEWLDCLEVYLPKQIIDATEDMILGMKQNTEKYQEFMLQQKNAKDCDAEGLD